MKIAFNGKEYANYLEPNAVDVLLDKTYSGTYVSTHTETLSNSISNYERIKVTAWLSAIKETVDTPQYVESNEVSVADILASRNNVKVMFVAWHNYADPTSDWASVTFTTNTSITLNNTNKGIVNRLKIEGIKKVAPTYGFEIQDITSSVTLNSKATWAGGSDFSVHKYGKLAIVHGNLEKYSESITHDSNRVLASNLPKPALGKTLYFPSSTGSSSGFVGLLVVTTDGQLMIHGSGNTVYGANTEIYASFSCIYLTN